MQAICGLYGTSGTAKSDRPLAPVRRDSGRELQCDLPAARLTLHEGGGRDIQRLCVVSATSRWPEVTRADHHLRDTNRRLIGPVCARDVKPCGSIEELPARLLPPELCVGARLA